MLRKVDSGRKNQDCEVSEYKSDGLGILTAADPDNRLEGSENCQIAWSNLSQRHSPANMPLGPPEAGPRARTSPLDCWHRHHRVSARQLSFRG